MKPLSCRKQSTDMQSKYLRLCLVYALFQPPSTFLIFIPPKVDLKKSTKKQLNFSNFFFCTLWKTEQLFIIFFFTYHSQKYFIKLLLPVVKVPYKSVLLLDALKVRSASSTISKSRKLTCLSHSK